MQNSGTERNIRGKEVGETQVRSTRAPKVSASTIAVFLACLGIGLVATLSPRPAVGLLVGLAVLGATWLGLRYLRRSGLEVWQIVLLMALSGYLVLNYGFENLAFHLGGVPIILSYLLVFGALGLAFYYHPNLPRIALQEPAVLFLLAIFCMACLHLVIDVPKYGIWAIRDASMCFDSVFIILGLLWSRKGSLTPLMKWLMIILLLNSVYSLTFPWQERIQAWSPTSGVFLQIPLFGYYRGNYLYLGLGALFYLFLSQNVFKWPRWIVLLLAMVQLFGLAILQARQMYIALLVIIVLLFLIGEVRKSGKLVLILGAPIAAVILLTVIGVEIPGRIGPVRADFFLEHFRSISGAAGTPGATVQGRMEWYDEVFGRIRNNPWVGEGFGQPLITFENDLTGGAVRQPHNSSVTVLARLGIAGLLPWLALHLYIVSRFVYAFRQRRRLDRRIADFILWLFMLYVVYMISSLVEPTFEFPSAAVPFYFFLGLSLGLIRRQLPVMVEQTAPHHAAARITSPAMF
jgi:O-antigen ligase